MKTVAATLLLLCLIPVGASAATCGVLATPLVFGTYDVFAAAPMRSVSTIVIECTTGPGEAGSVGYVVRLADVDAIRAMRNGNRVLAYRLHSDALRSQPWGDGGLHGPGVAGRVDTTAPLVPAVQTLYVYGEVAAGQHVAPGHYGSQVVVTIDY